MVNASIRAGRDLDAEMTVVRNEFESGENSAFGVLARAHGGERLSLAQLRKKSDHRGRGSDIENVPIERLRGVLPSLLPAGQTRCLLISGKLEETGGRCGSRRSTSGRSPGPSRARWRRHLHRRADPGRRAQRHAAARRRRADRLGALPHALRGTHAEYAGRGTCSLRCSITYPRGRLHKALVETGPDELRFSGPRRQQREAGFAYFGAKPRAETHRSRLRAMRCFESWKVFAKKPGHRRGGRSRAPAARQRHRSSRSPIPANSPASSPNTPASATGASSFLHREQA